MSLKNNKKNNQIVSENKLNKQVVIRKYKKKLKNKSDALKYEYFLKKNIKLRKTIKDKYIIKH